jgi:MerR-like DNA binding protein
MTTKPLRPLTTAALVKATGLAPATIRKLADRGIIRAIRDHRGWRKFAPSEVARLRRLEGFDVLVIDGGVEQGAGLGSAPTVSCEKGAALEP